MNLAFLLHFYQPPTQADSTLKGVVHTCYAPLLKLLRTQHTSKFTVNTPLSLLEQLDKQGYKEVIAQIKDLVDSERVELTGSAAYHPLLTKVSNEIAINQSILNEYALGYYFGQRKGFEGETSIMIKDIKGYFAPELALNLSVCQSVSELGYAWLAADSYIASASELTDTPTVLYSSPDISTKIITRDRTFSNLIAFKRDYDVDDLIDYLARAKEDGVSNIMVALDAETFGHHNKNGIDMLESFFEALSVIGINVISVSDMVDNLETAEAHTLDEINESTWSTAFVDGIRDNYPLWVADKNKLQKTLWGVFDKLVKGVKLNVGTTTADETYGNLAPWLDTELSKISDVSLQQNLSSEILFYKCLQSDQFWWSSRKTVGDVVSFSPLMVKNAVAIYKKLLETPLAPSNTSTIVKSLDAIDGLLA